MIAAGFLLWSLTTAATGLVRGFTILLVMRLMLGVGESVMIPACSKILGFHLPEHHRGFANGVLQGAWSSGPAIGTLGAGLLMAKYGWRPVFIGVGLTSLVWLPAWFKWMPRSSGAKVRDLPAAPGFADILRKRPFWGVRAGHFSVNYSTYFMLTWLPFYLVRDRHLSMSSMARLASAYYAVDALSAITTGWFSDFFIHRGYTPTLVRKAAMAFGHTVAAIALAGCAMATSQWYLLCLAAIGIGCGAARSGTFAFSQTLAGPRATGKWTGLQNGFANLSGVVAPASPGSSWIAPENSWHHSRSPLQSWLLGLSPGCLWSAPWDKSFGNQNSAKHAQHSPPARKPKNARSVPKEAKPLYNAVALRPNRNPSSYDSEKK